MLQEIMWAELKSIQKWNKPAGFACVGFKISTIVRTQVPVEFRNVEEQEACQHQQQDRNRPGTASDQGETCEKQLGPKVIDMHCVAEKASG